MLRFPMICDSCLHKAEARFVCTAFPDQIPLKSFDAELHDEPRPDQDNDIVYEFDPSKQEERDDFLVWRERVLETKAKKAAAEPADAEAEAAPQ